MSINSTQARKIRIKELLKNKDSRIHFVGVLGSGMKPLALLLYKQGYTVSGSDNGKGENDLPGGIVFYRDHKSENVKGATLVVKTYAVDEACPEIVEAQKEGIDVVYRAELLGALMEDFACPIGVCGTHGKSTTTAMLHSIFSYCRFSPTTISGANLTSGSSLEIGDDTVLVYEACEYRDAFLAFSPRVSVVLNIEFDHADYYRDMGQMFISYAAAHANCSRIIFNIDDPGAHTLYTLFSDRAVGFGTSAEADYRFEIISTDHRGSTIRINYIDGHSLIHLPVIGKAAAVDAVAAFALAHTLGLDSKSVCEALSEFCGIDRRLERLCSVCGKDIYYDYAHHPTEISNTIGTLRSIYGSLSVIFRPHTYTRTEALFDSFVSSLRDADNLVILDTFAARENKGNNRGATELARVLGCPLLSYESALSHALRSEERAVVLMGAGDLTPVVNEALRLSNVTK